MSSLQIFAKGFLLHSYRLPALEVFGKPGLYSSAHMHSHINAVKTFKRKTTTRQLQAAASMHAAIFETISDFQTRETISPNICCCVANREVAQLPLVYKLCNINRFNYLRAFLAALILSFHYHLKSQYITR